jgi:hypothetical protein
MIMVTHNELVRRVQALEAKDHPHKAELAKFREDIDMHHDTTLGVVEEISERVAKMTARVDELERSATAPEPKSKGHA